MMLFPCLPRTQGTQMTQIALRWLAYASAWSLVSIAQPVLAAPLPPVPDTPPQSVIESFHGTRVGDPYRWLENANDPAVKLWSDGQNARTRAYLDALTVRPTLKERLTNLITKTSPSYYGLHAAGGQLFAMYNQPPKQQPMIAVMGEDGDPAKARIVLDPNKLNAKGTTSIDWFVPSHDGKLIAVSLSENGSEDGALNIFEVASGKRVGEVIPRVQYPTGGGSMAWSADNKSFWYTRYPGLERPEADRHSTNRSISTPSAPIRRPTNTSSARICRRSPRSSSTTRMILRPFSLPC
jgi:prolyl oligopeptidase